MEQEVVPALGCTEPAAIALAVARVKELFENTEELEVEVKVSTNVFKNGMYVGIPGMNGERGNQLAAALSLLCGKSSYGLEVLKDCSSEHSKAARELIDSGRVHITCITNRDGVYIEALARSRSHEGYCVIEGHHDCIVEIGFDGKVIFKKDVEKTETVPTLASIDEVFELLREASTDELNKAYEGYEMNKSMAEFATANKKYVCLGVENSIESKIRRYCIEASGARMSGVKKPIMTTSGSGNQGIVATIPVGLVGEKIGASKEKISKAIILSHLFVGYIKGKLGRLTPTCGATNAAAPAAAAGITYLLGGSKEQIINAAQTVLAGTTGMLCDGAKESCAFKAGFGGSIAFSSALLSLEGRGVKSNQGLVGDSIERTLENIKTVSTKGMPDIENIMINLIARQQ
ncbi:serine dehydratase subunit alpha family protein [Kosmotoga pacifica]|nr:L-serine ammonia-lyase, iron-sulfur-dependent, subunit alpha [Kosmotoga pacifica]